MRVKVQSGQLLDLAKKALDALFRGIDKCMKNIENNNHYDLHIKEEQEVEEEGVKGKHYLFEVGDQGVLLEVTMFKIEDNEDSFMIRIEGDNMERFEKGPIKQDDIEKYVTDYCDKYNLGAVEEGVDVYDSTKISVTLQRVAGSTEDSITLTAIQANCNATQALTALDTVLSNDEFIDMITEEPQTFEIVEVDTAYDVEPTEGSVDTSNTFEIMLQSTVNTLHNLECIGWGCKGEKLNDLRNFIESLLWDVRYNVDTIAGWCVEYTKKVPNVLSYEYNAISPEDGFDFESGIKASKQLVDEYIDVLECYYVNVDHDVQAVMDGWIRNLKQKSNYYMDRTLLQSGNAVTTL